MKAFCQYFLLTAVSVSIVSGASELKNIPAENTSVWQWSVDVKGGGHRGAPSRAYLWIPPDCEHLRGVVVAQHNMEEIMILENTRFRQGLTELGFAEVWCSPPFDSLFRFDRGAGEVFDGMMADLAAESGYEELTYIPVVGIGHSAMASWPYYFAAWKPERTLAAVSVSGQWPYYRDDGKFAPDIWQDRNIDFVPCLETMGEYESAATWSREGLRQRQQHPLTPLSMLACPAEGHFAGTDSKAAYLAFYLKKAVQYRMPNEWSGSGPPELIPVDPRKTGWLMDKWQLDQEPAWPPAPVGGYLGDPNQAFWFFDEEMVRATEIYQSRYRRMKPQLVGYLQNGRLVPQRNTHHQVDLQFLPEPDGVTFKLTGTFLDTVPVESPRPASWVQLPAGSQIGHADDHGSIVIDRICGPFIKLSPDTFALRLERGLADNLKSYELYFIATHPGDGLYKPPAQQARMVIPLRNTEGADQQITFPAIPDQNQDTKILKLNAFSNAGVPVCYFVREGPAVVVGNMLHLTAIPPRSTFPVKVTVVAWQYGRRTEPKLKTANPVTRSFFVRK